MRRLLLFVSTPNEGDEYGHKAKTVRIRFEAFRLPVAGLRVTQENRSHRQAVRGASVSGPNPAADKSKKFHCSAWPTR